MKLFSTIKNTTTLLGVLLISAYSFAQDDCATSIPVVDLSGVVCATSAPSLTDQMAAGACEEGSLDTWFSFVAQGGSADITVSNNLSGWRPEFMVTSEPSNSCVGPFTAEDCIDQNGNYNTIAATSTGLIIGNTYWIIVSSNNDNTGGTISVCVDNPAVVVNCVDNEECSTAEVLALNAPDSGPLCLADCNNGATPGPNFTGNFCEDQLNPTVWYQFTTDPTTVGIDIDLSSVSDLSDPEFVLFTTPDCLTYTIVECVEGTGGSAQALNLVVSPSTTYFISISDVTGDEGDFDLCISQFSDQSPCNTNSSIVESSSSDPSTPVGGPYSYGEVVSFCYNITDWQIGASSNWLSGIVPTFGSGWDPASFDGSGMPVSISVPLVTAGSITNGTGGYAPCNGETAGWWTWYTAGSVIYNNVFATYGVPGDLPDGTPLDAGWFFSANYNIFAGNCSDPNDPNISYGDNNWQTAGVSTLDWDICFELIAGPVGNCTTGLTDLTVGMQTYADGEIGAWTSLGCVGNAQQVFPATLACCPVFNDPGDQFICDSYTLPIITGSLLTGNEAFYTGAGGTGTMYSSGNILNWSDFGAYPVTLYIYDATVPCGLEVPFELTIGQTPAVTMTALIDLCLNAGNQVGLSGGTIAGGVYSGPGVTDNGNGLTYNFDPSAAGTGTHTITYTVITLPNPPGCSSFDTDDVEVFALPVVTFTAPADLCIDAGVQAALGGGTPAGGIYSGPGVTDNGNGTDYDFDPAAAGVGIHTITYTYTDGNGCTAFDTDDVEVFALPTVTFTALADLCIDAGVQATLGGATPAGGIYSGPGVTDNGNGTDYDFDPAAAGVGIHTITYTYTDGNGCTAFDTDDVEVFALPTVTFTALADLCIDAGVQAALGGGTPAGGVYSGTGVTDDGNGTTYSFDPASAGAGTHTITYTYTDGNGCTAFDTDDVEVFALPTVTFAALADLCIDAGVQAALGGGTPAGGIYSGPGVTDNGNGTDYDFDPAAAGVGTHTITYTYTDGNGCTAFDTDDVEVFALPTVTFTALADLCIDAGVQAALGGGTPAGGVYSGTGVTDDGNGTTYSFDPASAGAGTHTITYTYTDGNGCTAFDTDDVEVFALPVVTFTAPADLCIDAGVQATLGGGTPAGGIYSGPGVTDNGNGTDYDFDPAAAGVGTHTITYTFTDVNGCTSSANDDVEVFALPVVVANATTITLCIGDPLTLTGSGASTYAWDNGVTDGTAFNPAATNNYTVTGTDVNGCINTDNIAVTVDPMPTVNPISPSECENVPGTGQALNIDVTGLEAGLNGSGAFIWFTDNTYATASAPQPTNDTVNNGQTFYFEVTIGTCTLQDSVTYSVSGNIVINDPMPEFCEDPLGSGQVTGIDLNTFNNAVFAGATTYTWATGPIGVTINDGDSVNVQVTQGSCPTVNIFVHFTVHPLPAANQAILNACDDGTGQGMFDLTSLNGAVDGGAGNTVVWYTDALLTVLATPDNAFVSGSTTVYAQVTNATTICSDTASITLTVDPLPVASQTTMNVCDDGTGQATFDLTTLNGTVDGGFGNTVLWYTEETLGVQIIPDNAFLTGTTIVYAQVDDGTCTDTASIFLTVDPLPTANQTTMNVCDNGTGQAIFDLTTLNVTVDGGGGNAVLWYTDGTLGTQIVPDNAFLTGDTTIYAQVTDGVTGCTDTASITLTVDPLPTAIDLTLTPCEDVLGGQSVAGVDLTLNEASIDGGAGNTMTWYSDATLTTLVVPPTNVTVNNGDVFYVLVDNGTCTDTAMVSYTVTGTITLTNPNDSLCEDAAGIGSVSGVDLTSYNATIFTGSGAEIFTWFDDAAMGATDSILMPSLGNYTIVSGTADTFYVYVEDGTCNNTIMVVFTVNPLPSAIQASMNLCDDGSGQATFDLTTLNITVGGGNGVLWYTDVTLGTQVVPDNAFLTGSTTVYAEVTDATTGCTDTASITLVVDPLPTALSISMNMCDDGSGQAIFDLTSLNSTVDGGAGNGFVWYTDDLLITLAVPDNAFLTGSTTVYAQVTDGVTGCTDTASVTLTVDPQAVIVAVSDVSVCAGDALTVTAIATGAGVITWTSDPAGVNVLETGLTYLPPTGTIGSTTYYVFEDGPCPSVMDTFIVTVGGVSANIVAAPTTGTIPLNVTLDGTLSTGAIVLWEWDFDNDGILDDFNPSTSNIYTTIGSYTAALTVADAAGCTSTITVTIDAFGESTLIIPNIFTPNGDGSNDVFNLSGTNITDIKGTIMNRWGQVVYQFNALEAGWNGRTVSGLEAAEGTYFYLIDAVGADGQEYNYQGPFQLIR